MAKGNEAYEIWWDTAGEEGKKDAFDFCGGYMDFLNENKTEREVSAFAIALLKEQGFADLDELLKNGDGRLLAPGTKVFRNVRGKAVLAAVVGRQPAGEGVNAIATHIDSPRLDFKQNPLYEDSHLVLAKTHYYGGIKKYQWVCMPLALHGVVYLKDGSQANISIGDKEGDPCFIITDLLPHLAQRQMEKKASEVIAGESLNILLGSIPQEKKDSNGDGAGSADSDNSTGNDKGGEGQPVKANILRILKEAYGIEERDFVSAEIEVVPALPVRDIGFDRGLIGGYGHDDRVCSYPALKALLDVESMPEKTSVVYLADKEEVGSQGNTGAQSVALGNFLAELCAMTAEGYSDLAARRCYAASCMLSGDVGSGVDPNFKDVQDPLNANYLGKGIMLEKYTGRGGKSGGSDADPAFIAAIRRILDQEGIPWQTGEIGKVDLGGGGTVAAYMANMGMQVLDCGVPVLSMHAPYEVVSKGDVYNTYRAYKTFLQNHQ
ncbi:MAG: aminopeptidase [Clostridiales bacterium]|nr:aminopeptidase [Clostridiales bacterium]